MYCGPLYVCGMSTLCVYLFVCLLVGWLVGWFVGLVLLIDSLGGFTNVLMLSPLWFVPRRALHGLHHARFAAPVLRHRSEGG